MKTALSGALILTLLLPLCLFGCAGSREGQPGKPSDGMLQPQDPSSGNRGRDLYDEMQREEAEEGLD